MMHMTFYWGKQATILFDGWKTTTWLSYSLSLVALFLSSIVLQYFSNLEITNFFTGKTSSSTSFPPIEASLLGKDTSSTSLGKKLLRSGIFGVRVGIGYLLMLAAMSFNGGVFIAIVLGFAVGHFVFFKDTTLSLTSSEEDANACGC
ncbi:hypothetical protein KP509_12G003700 [Ceratopteris richardii]|uniref:Copper transport protein n=1 Tax=Ceratopteris richardii TaxID=49495 RepID=A0A8T2TLQ4_CERRI|nr:hypothetical protein KP509_12G003700 [Ceratopteris richardii]